MKTTSGIVCGAMLALSVSWPAGAGEIEDTYSSGDTLTATMMNNIKAAVNDNNTAVRFYGDGSANDLSIYGGATHDWTSAPPVNMNFQNVSIEAGSTLIVPAGTTIRCTGSFVNRGTIEVRTNGKAGYRSYTDSDASGSWSYTGVPASPGDTGVSSQPGASGTGNVLAFGYGGNGIPRAVAASAFMSFRWGGGASSGTRYAGNRGGGLLKVLCQGEVRNEAGAEIRAMANGSFSMTGSGGGGGGIVVLASQQSVVNAGNIDVSGGDGGRSNTYIGAGGGGGGGIAILVAPQVTNSGTVDVSGGAAGSESASTGTATGMRYAGAGGGASGGDGGHGTSLNADGISVPATPGEDGYVLEIEANPATMM